MKIILRLFSYTKSSKHYIPKYFIYALLATVFGLINYTLLIPLLDILFKKITPKVVPYPDFSFSIQYWKDLYLYSYYSVINDKGVLYALFYTCGVIFIALAISNFFKYLSSRVMGEVKINLLKTLRNEIYSKLIHQDLTFHQQHKKGHLLSILTGGIQEIESSIGNSIQNLIKDPLLIIAYLGTLFYISPELTVFTFLFFPLSGWSLSVILKKLKKQGHYSHDLLEHLFTLSEESLGGIKTIKAFHAETILQKNFERLNNQFSKVSRSMYNRREIASPVSELIGVTIMLILISYGGYLVLHKDNNISGSHFIAYLAIYSQMLNPLKNIANTIGFLQKSKVIGERIFAILDRPTDIIVKTDTQPKKDFERDIVFENVFFKYRKDWILKNINLTLRRGEHIALVGKSGSGKTTLADLILHLYPITKGRLIIDGIPIEDINLKDWHQLIGFVGQEPILFNDSVINNIVFGSTEIDMDRVVEACKIANAHPFIEQLENGYHTEVGDRGSKLSGGQKQRITIARALYHNPPILILDEATASLDSIAEKQVQEALDKVTENRTSIVIAHRLSTIINADKIIVLNEGEIVETGTHKNLIQQQGIYYNLIKLQQF